MVTEPARPPHFESQGLVVERLSPADRARVTDLCRRATDFFPANPPPATAAPRPPWLPFRVRYLESQSTTAVPARPSTTGNSFGAANPHAITGARERGVAFGMMEDEAVSIESDVRIAICGAGHRRNLNPARDQEDEGEAGGRSRGTK
jgi:hypothetical protein